MILDFKWNNDSGEKNRVGRGVLFLILLLNVVSLISCSGFFKKMMKDPKIKLERVDVTDTNLKGAKLNFILSVENPNSFEIKVDEVHYKVFLGDEYFASSKTPKPVTIPAGSKVEVALPLPVEFSKFLKGVGHLIAGETLTYKVEGEARLAFLGLNIPFVEKGDFHF